MKETSSTRFNDNKGDHQMPKKSRQKCEVYVHKYSKIPHRGTREWCESEIHRNAYNHEFSDYYERLRSLGEQFDNLSLQNAATRPTQAKVPQVNSLPVSKISKLLSHKAAVDRLEETYWSKWKPLKSNKHNAPVGKALFLAEEVEKMSKAMTAEVEKVTQTISYESVTEQTEAVETETFPSTLAPVQMQLVAIPSLQKDMTVSDTTLIPNRGSEISVTLKHTDSLIVASKKRSVEKSPYQQPKCIRLFKNAGYVSCTSTNYIKGGSYPLKSCLKRSTPNKPSCLGRPGSPIKSNCMTKCVKKPHFVK